MGFFYEEGGWMNKEYFEDLFDKVDFAIADHEMIYDEFGDPMDYSFLYVNQAFCNLIGRSRKEIIGSTVCDLFSKTERFWIDKYQLVIQTGEPTSFINYAEVIDRYLSVYAYKSGEKRFITSFKDITSFISTSNISIKDNIVSNLFSEGKNAYFEFDIKNKQFAHSETLKDIIGMEVITYQDYIDMFSNFTHPADQNRTSETIKGMFQGEINEIAMQIRFFNPLKKDYVWISFFAYIEKRYRNVPILIKGIIKDIDNEKKQILKINELDRMFKETRKVANICTFYFSFQTMKFTPSVELNDFVGLRKIEAIEDFRRIVHPEDIYSYDFSTEEIKRNPEGVVSNYRIIKDNEIRYIQSSVFGEYEESGKIIGVFGILKDNTEIERSKREIEFFANHDVLTGLYNRNNFEIYNKTLDGVSDVGVFVCDVDGLKLINDAFSHLEGDELLVSLAKTLLKVSNTDKVFRIGGDEFVIILRNATEEMMMQMSQDIKFEISKFRIHSVGFAASIGYAFIEDGKSFEETFRSAENLMYRRKLTERKSRKSNALSTIMQTMHEKTEETEEHCNRVGELAAKVLKQSGKKRDYEIEEIKLVASLHDIGKISISDKILNKPSELDDFEYEQIKYHSESGYKIISNIIDNEDIAIAVLYHHERYDGTGYPHGLKGENIPLYSRIISICDAYDAMTSDRGYRAAYTKKQAIKEIKRNAGTQFDPILVERFLKIVK